MNLEEYFEQGFVKQLAEKYEEAIKNYNKVLELDKDFERAYVQRAYCKGKLEDYEGAIEDYKTGLSLNPNDPKTYYNLACIMYKMDYDTKDISYIQKAIELGEDEVFAYCIRGSIAYNIKEYQLAINDFTIAMDRDFCRDICYYNRAKCYLFLDNIEKAIEIRQKIV